MAYQSTEKENSVEIKAAERGSFVYDSPGANTSIYTNSPHPFSTMTINSISRYGTPTTPNMYEKNPLPPSNWSYSNKTSTNTNTFDDSDFPSLTYPPNKFVGEAEKIQEHYVQHGVVMSPKDYFGHMKVNRYDFTTEEPYARKERNAKANCPVHGTQGRNTKINDEQEIDVETVGERNSLDFDVEKDEKTVVSGQKEQLAIENNNRSKRSNIHLETQDQLLRGQKEDSKPQYSWSGHSQQERSYNNSFNETCVLERPMDFGTSQYAKPSSLPITPKAVLPNINSFTSPIQYLSDFGYRGMANPFFPPVMYPGNFDSSIFSPYIGIQSQFYQMFGNDPYYWLHERTRDMAASIYPTVIRPKPVIGAVPFANLTGSQEDNQLLSMSHHMAYPNPAAMFRAANLIPSFYLRKENALLNQEVLTSEAVDNNTPNTNNITTLQPNDSISISGIKAQNIRNNGFNQNSTPFVSHPKLTSQVPWIKADNTVSYTFAAAPSEVMTYLPQTVPKVYDGVETGDGSDEDEKYLQDECNGTYFSLQESFRELKDEKEAKKLVSPPRKTHACNICGKTYARAFTLKTHQRVHTGEKPFKCKVCQRYFAQGSGLESHMRIHTGEKPYKCKVCFRAFSHSSAVKSHLRTHTGEKPFRCNCCGKHFGDQSTLKKHNRVHTGEKPFKCHICHFTFTQVGNMNKHLRNIHGENLE